MTAFALLSSLEASCGLPSGADPARALPGRIGRARTRSRRPFRDALRAPAGCGRTCAARAWPRTAWRERAAA
eukprot:2136652-Alexandrium_andersonii.AAC.1